jgi:uncharacterized membrane protein YciS (DUF1049 family)
VRQLLLALLGAAIFVAALILGWRFGAANTALVEVDLLAVRLSDVTVWKLVVTSFALGAVVVALGSGFFGLRGWVLKRRYRKVIRRLESEIHQLRSLPLAGDELPTADEKTLPLSEGRG